MWGGSAVYSLRRPTTYDLRVYDSTVVRMMLRVYLKFNPGFTPYHSIRMSGVLYAVLLDCLHDYQLHVTLHMVLRVCMCVFVRLQSEVFHILQSSLRF